MNVPLVHRCPVAAEPITTKVMPLVVKGVSLTTISAILEPLRHANFLLGQDKIALQPVSLANETLKTQTGFPVPCHTSSTAVVRGRPVQ